MSKAVVFIPLLVAILLLGWFVYKHPVFVPKSQPTSLAGMFPVWQEGLDDSGNADDYVDCVLEDNTVQQDDYVDCAVNDKKTCNTCNSDCTNDTTNKLYSIIQKASADQGLPALLTILESQKTTMPPLLSFAPTASPVRAIGYAEALSQFYREMNNTYSFPPDYQEVRKLLHEMDVIVGLARKENKIETTHVFVAMIESLKQMTQYDPGNPNTFMQPTTEKWNGFVVANTP